MGAPAFDFDEVFAPDDYLYLYHGRRSAEGSEGEGELIWRLLILQQQLSSRAAAIVTALGACLMEAAPARPLPHRLRGRQDAHHQAIDQSAHCRQREGNQLSELSHGGPPLGSSGVACAAPGRGERTTARY